MKRLSKKQQFKAKEFKRIFGNNVSKSYVATKALGLPPQSGFRDAYFKQYNELYSDKKHSINHSIFQRILFLSLDKKGFSSKNLIKDIKVLKKLGVSHNEIVSHLFSSQYSNRVMTRIATVKRDKLAAYLKSKESFKPHSEMVLKLKNSYKANKVLTPKETISENKEFVGIELEFFSEFGRESIIRKAEALKIKNFNIGSDGSIEFDSDDYPDHSGHEVRVLLENNPEYIDKHLKKVCKVLNDTDSRVNQSCGFHVHLDVRNKSEKEIKEIELRFLRCLKVLALLVPESRRDNGYCQLKASDNDRYSAINLCAVRKYGTIEIRLHSGTVDFLKISNWIKLLNLIKETKNSKTFKTFDEMIEGLRMPDDLAAFYYNRFKKFNSGYEEQDLNESSIVTIDQITFSENQNNNSAITA